MISVVPTALAYQLSNIAYLYNALVPPPYHLPNANSELERPPFSDARVKHCAIGQRACVVLQTFTVKRGVGALFNKRSPDWGNCAECFEGCEPNGAEVLYLRCKRGCGYTNYEAQSK
jgi:hypothetical protein